MALLLLITLIEMFLRKFEWFHRDMNGSVFVLQSFIQFFYRLPIEEITSVNRLFVMYVRCLKSAMQHHLLLLDDDNNWTGTGTIYKKAVLKPLLTTDWAQNCNLISIWNPFEFQCNGINYGMFSWAKTTQLLLTWVRIGHWVWRNYSLI